MKEANFLKQIENRNGGSEIENDVKKAFVKSKWGRIWLLGNKFGKNMINELVSNGIVSLTLDNREEVIDHFEDGETLTIDEIRKEFGKIESSFNYPSKLHIDLEPSSDGSYNVLLKLDD